MMMRSKDPFTVSGVNDKVTNPLTPQDGRDDIETAVANNNNTIRSLRTLYIRGLRKCNFWMFLSIASIGIHIYNQTINNNIPNDVSTMSNVAEKTSAIGDNSILNLVEESNVSTELTKQPTKLMGGIQEWYRTLIKERLSKCPHASTFFCIFCLINNVAILVVWEIVMMVPNGFVWTTLKVVLPSVLWPLTRSASCIRLEVPMIHVLKRPWRNNSIVRFIFLIQPVQL